MTAARLQCLMIVLACAAWPAAADARPAADEPLVVVYSPIGPPLIIEDGNGQPEGLVIDFWRHIAEHMGRELRFELASWSESMQRVRDGRADAHAALLRTDARQAELAFSEPLLEIEVHLFVPVETAWLNIHDVGDGRIGVVAGSYAAEALRGQHPQADFWHFVDPEAMVRAAVEGWLEAFALPLPAGTFLLDKLAAQGRFRPLPALPAHALRAATAMDGDPVLLEEINRALAAMTPEQRRHLVSRWHSGQHQFSVPGWLWSLFGAVLALVIIASLVIYSTLLKKRVEAATRQCRRDHEQLAVLLDNLPIAVSTYDPTSGQLVSANRAALEAQHVQSLEQLRDRRRWAEPPFSCEEAREWLERAMREGPQRLQWKALRADGSSYWAEVLLQSMNCDGQPMVVSASVDISAHKRIVRMQRNFIDAMAHELRTPLAIIETALANLRLQIGQQMPELLPRLDRMARAMKRLNVVVAKALAVDASEQERIHPHPRFCRPSELLQHVLEMLDHNQDTHPLHTHLPDDDRPLAIDCQWLSLAILNLLDNAVKYSPEGDEVDLTMRHTGQGLEICVADRGPGIAPQHREHLFDRFYRISESPRINGMGIGLYLVRLIATRHGGTARFEERPGGGSRFVIEVTSLTGDS